MENTSKPFEGFLTIINPSSFYGENNENRELNLATSVMWIINDSAYCPVQMENPGPVFLSNEGSLQKYKETIDRYKRSLKALEQAKKITDSKSKAAFLVSTLPWTYLRDKTLEELGESGDEGLKVLENLLPKDTFDFSFIKVLEIYGAKGKEKIAPALDSIYKREITYWKNNIATLRGKPYWGTSSFEPRFSFLSHLVSTAAINRLPGWQDKALEVRDFFKHESSYTPPKGRGRIDNNMDELLRTY